ncbi:MAG TPA: serine hydrolase [Opitutaceae bacterium]|jgi:CubicO group peptidase (beta-lactamase class C family)
MRAYLLLACLMAAIRVAGANEPWPEPEWTTVAPEAEGIDSDRLAEGLRAVRQRQIRVHSILIVRDGKLVLDATFFPFRPEETHDLASCTKSVTSTLIGAAIARGDLRGVDQPVLPIFTGLRISNPDARKDRIRLEDVLSMRSGLDCHFDHAELTLQQMMASPHWVPFMLDLPMAADPGMNWVYCSGGFHLLSGVISKVEGRSALEFARQVLFKPLGIAKADWLADADGVSTGWGNLELRPRDAAKLGYLWLNLGAWNGRQIVRADYLQQATSPLAVANPYSDYGWGFWVNDHHQPSTYEAVGRGGQRITVSPQQHMVVVLTGSDFNPDDIGAAVGPAFHDGPLPPNPAGEVKLRQALSEVARPPAAVAPAALPKRASLIAGRTYRLSPAPFGTAALTLRFDRANEGSVVIEEINGQRTSLPIGLDGVPRLSPNPDAPGHMEALKGEWKTPDTFVFDVDQVAKINAFEYTLTFRGDTVTGDVNERTGLGQVAFQGSLDTMKR